MKKLLFTALLSLLVIGVSAQKKTLKSAQKELNKKNYDGAIELATAASTDPETKDNPDVYIILGQATMYNYNAGDNKDLDLAQKSYDYFQMAMEKGDAKVKEKITEEVVLNPATGLRLGGGEGTRYLEIFVISQANVHFQAAEYEEAYGFFVIASKIIEDVAYDFYAGYCAQNAEMDDDAIMYFEKVVNSEAEFENENFAYNGLIDIYNRREDWDNALKYIKAAKELFPEEKLYSDYEIEVLINAERMDQAIQQLKDVVSKGGANADSYYTLAWLQFNNEELDDALASAEEALNLKPDYHGALYIAGSVHYNKAAELLKVANNETDNEKYENLKNQALELFKKTLPYFEKALSLKEDDTYVLNPLSTIYDQLGMDSKRDEILKKLESLENNGG